LDNICQIQTKCYYSYFAKFFGSKQGQGRNKETGESNGHVLTFRNRESCGSEPAKAKKIISRKSQQTVVAASKIQKMIFFPLSETETEESSQGHQEQTGTQVLPAPNHKRRKNSTRGAPTSKPTPKEFASRKRAKKRGSQELKNGMDGS